MECLDKIIKLSRTQCECFDTDKPTDYSEGKSDIYLDELEGINLDIINANGDCENGNLWELMSKARENATKQFKADILAYISTNYQSRRPNYSGLVGNISFNSNVYGLLSTAGIVLRPAYIIGGYLYLKRLGLIFNSVQTFDIEIYSNEDLNNPIAAYEVTTAANSTQYVDLTEPLKLPLWSNNVSSLEYYIVYNNPGGFYPKNNTADCGCTNKSKIAYKSWVNAYGFNGSSLSSYNTTKEFNGLVLDVDLRCESSRLICSNEYPLDFDNDGIAAQMAYAVRFKAGEILLDTILSSGEINRYTMMDRDALYGKRNHYRAKYESLIGFIGENIEVTNNDCLICRNNSKISKGSILA